MFNGSHVLISYSLWKADADLSATAHQAKAAGTQSIGGTSKDIVDARSIKIVMAGSGCQVAEKVKQVSWGPGRYMSDNYLSFIFFFICVVLCVQYSRFWWYLKLLSLVCLDCMEISTFSLCMLFSCQVLGQVYGDVDQAIEFLIAEQGTGDYLVQNDSLPGQEDISHGNGRLVLFAL